jgi:hypothetical protein
MQTFLTIQEYRIYHEVTFIRTTFRHTRLLPHQVPMQLPHTMLLRTIILFTKCRLHSLLHTHVHSLLLPGLITVPPHLHMDPLVGLLQDLCMCHHWMDPVRLCLLWHHRPVLWRVLLNRLIVRFLYSMCLAR